jgi:hypothetical protein
VSTVEERIAVGDRAKELLDDPLFNGVISALTMDYMNELIDHPPGSEDGIAVHACIKGLNDIKARLRRVANDGAMAKNQAKKHSG